MTAPPSSLSQRRGLRQSVREIHPWDPPATGAGSGHRDHPRLPVGPRPL